MVGAFLLYLESRTDYNEALFVTLDAPYQLNGYVQVSMPVPSNINVNSGKAITVYRLEDAAATQSPKTGDDSYMNYIVWMMVFIIELGFVATAKKKYIDIFLIKCVIISI